MSSGGQVAGGVLGAVAGFLIGGPTASLKGALYGAQIGMAIGGYLDPPKGPVQEGPRLSDLTVQTSTYGAVIPRGYGTFPVVGNVFWLENNALKETITKKKSGGKGGGSKTTTKTYSYSATFAVGLLDCTDGTPIAGVRRIWIGGRLWYDAGASDLATVIASNEVASTFTIQTGSTTQAANARMQATLGVANTPAYRGLAYIVFNDLPLAPYSNSLVGAQVKVEVVKAGTTSMVLLADIVKPYTKPNVNPGYSPQPYYMSAEVCIFYVPQWDGSAPFTFIKHEIYLDGRVVQSTIPTVTTNDVAPNGLFSGKDMYLNLSTDVFTGGGTFDGPNGFISESNGLWVGLSNFNAASVFERTIFVKKDGVQRTTPALSNDSAITTDGTYIYVCGLTSTRKYDSDLNLLQTGSAASSGVGVIGHDRCVVSEGTLYFARTGGGTAIYVYDSALAISLFASGVVFPQSYYATNFIVVNRSLIILAGGTSPPTKNLEVKYYNLNSINGTATTLASIVQTECLKSKLLTAGDINVTALTQVVKGYRLGNVAAIRAGLEPLQAAWPFDVLQSGYTIKFKVRGSSSVATVPATDLDARSAGETPGVSITNTREMDSVLPRRVTLSYLDTGREYDDGEQYAERLNTDSVNVRSIDLTIALTSAEAAAMAEVLLYLYWMERYDLSFSLPPTYSALEPGDTITVNAAEATYTLRLTAITYTQDGRLECEAKYASSAVYTAAALGESGQSTGIALTFAGGSLTEFLDVPTLDDSLDLAGYPVAMTGYLAGWPGGVVYRSDDGGQTWTDMQAFAPPGAVIGWANNSIGAPPSLLMDKGNLLLVSLHQGTLSSVSELAMFSGANYFAYGAAGRWEIIAAQTCTLQGDGSYVLQDFLRGQKGTEWASGLHAVGDKLIELDSSLAFVVTSANTIGLAKLYRGVTDGRSLDAVSDQSFTYRGVNLRPLSPVYLNGNRHPASNDWTLTWIRRTRVGGAWRDYVDATLSEATESYEVEIYSSGAYTTIKRTLTGLSSATATYTSAQQVTDFGSNQATLYVKIYQISAVVGRGYPLTTSITR
ncbi:phage tail protein [Propionivibrio sp.]|uniref:phage tail protein n=1 Tax=Propionivibrio sp. TaxID=2212460 RepID=UPI0025E090DB|nr:phage tail protein [Propionivibrio sp.]MBK8745695.1 hypothetical protein [Propionivibrio sp.]